MKKLKPDYCLIFYRQSDIINSRKPALVHTKISAVFSGPDDDDTELSIDLNKELIKNPAATFYGHISGNSMQHLGIKDGDLLVIDKSLEPADGDIAVCFLDGEFTLKKIKVKKDVLWLLSTNTRHSPIRITEENNSLIWGIVTHTIRKNH